jgi:membrane peptidoglycan carboxypeptidase
VDGGIVSGRYESLIARRRRQARLRRNLRIAAGFALLFAVAVLGLELRDMLPSAAVLHASLPDVAAAGSSVIARAEPIAPPPPPIAIVPPELVATLPPTARSGLASAPPTGEDRVFERVEIDQSSIVPGPLEIEYTLDAALSRRVASILAPVELGHVVVLDPVDGRLLAYASTEPKSFPATRPYPTASLMKVVTATAVLERAPDAAERPCRFVGSPYYLAQNLLDPPARGHSSTFVQALAMSNNQCFAQLAVNELGSLTVIDTMERLGLLEPPAPGHLPGEVDPVHDRLELGKLGSGLAGSRISPLAAARLAAVMLDGQVVAPHWIARVRDANGTELRMPEATPPRPAFAPALTAELRTMMIETTERGTARRAFRAKGGGRLLDTISVAGKTGSLNGQNPDGHYEWFIGLAPADAPKVAIATLVVNRGKWRKTASQVAAETLHAMFCGGGACRDAGRGADPEDARAERAAASEGRRG